MERKIWKVFKSEICVFLSDSEISDHVKNYGKWPKPLSHAVKGCLNRLAVNLNETFICSSKDSSEFLVDGIICKGKGRLNQELIKDNHCHKGPMAFPVGEISYAVEWEWDPGRDAVYFATRDIPKLKYLNAANKVIVYSRVNSSDDLSRVVIENVLSKTSLVDDNVTIIEFERNDDYQVECGNRLIMNLLCNRTFQVIDHLNVFPIL